MKGLLGTLAALLLLAGCGTEPGGAPTFDTDGGDADLDALVQQAGQIGLRECPEPAQGGPAPGGDPGDVPQDEAADDAGAPLPELHLTCLHDGEPVDLSRIEGPAVVNLWASWCKPCREELPLLARLDEEAGEEVSVIGIDVADRAPEAALELAERSGVTYPQLFDPDQLTRAPLRVVGLPQTVFVDEQGIMVATERTPYRSYGDLTAALDRHLGVRP
ncbi:TlpA family protein disulfide reductase [Aeromicrobium sp. CTD01-1L150]|uniref:TlpA family protein disulfide reductase n=1 Tax=Aeromicrobium sp. CTD01-1L150 TaxID=3341830 RepID=UPI0035C20A32